MAQGYSAKFELRVNAEIGAQLLIDGKSLPGVQSATVRKADDGVYLVSVDLLVTDIEFAIGNDVKFES